MWRHRVALSLYIFSVMVSVGNLIVILYIHRVPLFTGKGLGSFVPLWFLLYFSVSVTAWAIASLLERNRRWSAIYWLTILFAVALMALVPMKFYID